MSTIILELTIVTCGIQSVFREIKLWFDVSLMFDRPEK